MLPARAAVAAPADLAALKVQTKARDPAANAAVAQEFEKLFGEMLVGAMRQASFGDSMFPGENGLYRQLYDKEVVKQMSAGGGLGIADLMMKQLRAQDSSAADESTAAGATAVGARAFPVPPRQFDARANPGFTSKAIVGACNAPQGATNPAGAEAYPMLRAPLPKLPAARVDDAALRSLANGDATTATRPDDPRHAFVAKIFPYAQKAAQSLGVPVEIIVAQAVLETGWGKSGLANKDNNLFGVKAGSSWNGARAQYATREYVAGNAVSESAQFRGYDSVAGSFDDYVAVLSKPRYANAVANGADASRFAHALQHAGYATDPQYATKLLSIARGGTMRAALASLDTDTLNSTAAFVHADTASIAQGP
jgi:peptidoglycan hydrolase FlgJ